MLLALGWADVAAGGEILVGLFKVLSFLVSHPGTYMVVGGAVLMGLTLWASAKTEGALQKFKVASVPGLAASAICVVLVVVGLLNLFGILALKDTTEKTNHARPAQVQEAHPGPDLPVRRGGLPDAPATP